MWGFEICCSFATAVERSSQPRTVSDSASVDEEPSTEEEEDVKSESLITAELMLLEQMFSSIRPAPDDGEYTTTIPLLGTQEFLY